MSKTLPILPLFGLVLWLVLHGGLASVEAQESASQPPAIERETTPEDRTVAAETEMIETAAIETVTIEAVRVEPAIVGPETLCKLRVTLHNRGPAMASLLGFEVKVGDVVLPGYAKDLFVIELPPGERRDVELFNFWSSETGRPLPEGETLMVTVRLLEATYFETSRGGDEVEPGPLETWTPLGPVEGLPSEGSAIVESSDGEISGDRSEDATKPPSPAKENER